MNKKLVTILSNCRACPNYLNLDKTNDKRHCSNLELYTKENGYRFLNNPDEIPDDCPLEDEGDNDGVD